MVSGAAGRNSDELRERVPLYPRLYCGQHSCLHQRGDGFSVQQVRFSVCRRWAHVLAVRSMPACAPPFQTLTGRINTQEGELDLISFHPDGSLPSTMDDNPLVWMMEVNGFLVDIRMAPRDAQVAAYEKSLIPYIPADR